MLVLNLCCFLAHSVVYFVFVWLHGVSSGLGVYVVVRYCLVVLCVDSGFFIASQLALQLSLFLLNYITSLLVSVFTASCVTTRLSCVLDLDFLSLFSSPHGFLRLITWRLFICLARPCACSCVLCDLHNGTESTGCVFPTYTLHLAFNSIVSLPLQSTICINCSSPTPLLRKCWAASLLSSSSFGRESPCSAGEQLVLVLCLSILCYILSE